MKPLAVATIAALMLAACAENTGAKQGLGTVMGAVACGIAGSQVGKGRGQLVARPAADPGDGTSPKGTVSSWHNPDSGNAGTVTPVSTVQRADGAYWREFHQTVTAGGRTEEAYGAACRQADGSWKIVSG